jgi:hypothetical protein
VITERVLHHAHVQKARQLPRSFHHKCLYKRPAAAALAAWRRSATARSCAALNVDELAWSITPTVDGELWDG